MGDCVAVRAASRNKSASRILRTLYDKLAIAASSMSALEPKFMGAGRLVNRDCSRTWTLSVRLINPPRFNKKATRLFVYMVSGLTKEACCHGGNSPQSILPSQFARLEGRFNNLTLRKMGQALCFRVSHSIHNVVAYGANS